MPLSDSEPKGLKADAKRKAVSAEDSLFVIVESVGKGGGKQVKVRIGPYGRGAGKWTLKAARKEWDDIGIWRMEASREETPEN